MEGLLSPILLYTACVIGAVGVCLALPRRGVSPQILGALVAALAVGLLFIGLGVKAGKSGLPNFNFYLFSFIALGGALRVISHPRPVYAALYFILTIIASAGLYVLLSAEFMAFALVIVYAGAILITYLFVIMLATESPTADQVEALSDFDRYSREPMLAAIAGFVLVAGATTMIGRGAAAMPVQTQYAGAARIELLPKKIEAALRTADLMSADEQIARDPETHELMIDLVGTPDGVGRVTIALKSSPAVQRVVTTDNPKWPKDLTLTNIEGVGFTLLADHPGAIEIAGVVLLMAMLGAVVLARKKVEIDDSIKYAAQQRSLAGEFTAEHSPLMAPAVPGGPTTREAETRSMGEAVGAGGMSGRGGAM